MTIQSKTSARGAISSIFGTVNSTAQTITSVFDTANESVGMLSAYVDVAAKKQRDAHKVDLHTSRKVLMERVAMEEAERRVDIMLRHRSTIRSSLRRIPTSKLCSQSSTDCCGSSLGVSRSKQVR
jgi:hypothetical protein